MTVTDTMAALEWLRKHLEEAEPDLLREMVRSFINTIMGAEADALWGAPYGERSADPAHVTRDCAFRWDVNLRGSTT